MYRLISSLIGVAFLSGCANLYTPVEYPLRDGLIPSFDLSGPVSVSNNQPSSESVVVYSYMGSKLTSDLKTITDVMVKQAQNEIQKNGRPGTSSTSKTIALKVTSLRSNYIVMFWKSNIEFEATLGDGQVIALKVPHSSGVLIQDLNGCVAEGVLTLLKDERVRAYLATGG